MHIFLCVLVIMAQLMRKKYWGKKRKYEHEQQFQARIVRDLAYKVRKIDERVPIVETHFINIVQGAYSPGTAGTIHYLSQCAEGVGDQDRRGNTIFARLMQFRAEITSTTEGIAPYCRFIFFADKLADGVAPVKADVLFNGTMRSHHNLNFSKRFWILRDILFTDADAGGTWLVANANWVEDTRKLRFPITYITDAAAQAAAGPNSIYLLSYADSADTRVQYEWQMPFVDS